MASSNHFQSLVCPSFVSQRQSAKQWIELHSSGLDPSVVRVNVMIRVIDVVKWHMGVKSGSSERGVSGEDGQQQPLTPHSVLLLLPFCDSRGTEADMLVLR